MKTNIICIHGRYVVKTGKVFVYESNNQPVFSDEGELVDFDEYTFSEEIVDVCTGEHFGFDGIIHLIGEPIDAFTSRYDQKRGRHSRSNNRKAARRRAFKASLVDDLPF